MPCVYISTNVSLDGVELEPIFDEITKAVASIIGKPERYVMVILKGSLAMKFWGNKEAAAFGEVVSMGGINTQVKRKLISTLGAILQDKLSIPTARALTASVSQELSCIHKKASFDQGMLALLSQVRLHEANNLFPGNEGCQTITTDEFKSKSINQAF